MGAPPTFRVIDTGVRDGRLQIAFDQALIELHKDGAAPDTIRFLRFPPTVLVGRHQAVSHEVRLDHVRAKGWGLVRRITGGGAIYLDEGQLGWELVFHRRSLPLARLDAYARAICEAVAAGLSKAFAIDARFRPRNDIEVDGRKLCGTGGFFDGDTLIYQGTVLIDLDPQAMLAGLRVPQAKLDKRALHSLSQRVVTLSELLGKAPSVASVQRAVLDGLEAGLGIVAAPGPIGDAEEALAAKLWREEIGTDDFVFEIDAPGGPDVRSASHTGAGGTVTVFLRLDNSATPRIRDALITGDFFVTPPRIVYDLEAALRGVAAAEVSTTVASFFCTAKADMLSLSPADFATAIEAAALAPPAR